jgi:hypothetical protein
MKRLLPLAFLFVFACTTMVEIPPGSKNLLEPVARNTNIPNASDVRDRNGLLFNPHWRCQDSNCYGKDNLPNAVAICDHDPAPPAACAVPLNIDLPGWWTCYLDPRPKIPGHVNRAYATLSGEVRWAAHNDDFDYEFLLTPANQHALTENSRRIAIEFNSHETFEGVDRLTERWGDFKDHAVRMSRQNNAYLRAMFSPGLPEQPNGSIVGLLGLDCQHKCHPELHPVYGMAIRTADQDNNPNTETWMLFARNWGGEGSCSENIHVLPAPGQLHVLIPQRIATGFEVIESEFRATSQQIPDPVITFAPGEGALVTFGLSDPEEEGMIEGSLHVRWLSPQPLSHPRRRWRLLRMFLDREKGVSERGSSEAALARELGRLSKKERDSVLFSITAAVPKKPTFVKSLERGAAPPQPSPAAPPPPPDVQPSQQTNTRQQTTAKTILNELCKRLDVVRGSNGENLCPLLLPAPQP